MLTRLVRTSSGERWNKVELQRDDSSRVALTIGLTYDLTTTERGKLVRYIELADDPAGSGAIPVALDSVGLNYVPSGGDPDTQYLAPGPTWKTLPSGGGGGGGTLPYTVVSAATQTAFQNALNTARHVVVPAGLYNITSSLTLTMDHQRVEFEPGVEIRATAAMTAMMSSTDFDYVKVIGSEDTYFNLNELADQALRLRGVAKEIKKPVMGKLRGGNNLTPNTFIGCFEVRKAYRPQQHDISINDYGFDNNTSTLINYSCYAENCRGARMYRIDVEHCRVGIEFFDCFDSKAQSFDIRDTSDNGIYCTGDVGADNKFVMGTIDGCEEGLVMACERTTAQDLTIRNCTNTGVTFRGRSGCKILGGHFDNNVRHIGDDNGTSYVLKSLPIIAAEDFLIDGASFGNCGVGSNMIQMRRFRRGRIINSYFKADNTSASTVAWVVVAGNSDDNGSGKDIEINRCTFDDVNKLTPNGQGLIRFSTQSSLVERAGVSHCKFLRATTAIVFFNATGTPGTGYYARRNTYVDVDLPVSRAQTTGGLPKVVNEPLLVSPDEIGNVVAWYDADQIALPDNTSVGNAATVNWLDLSGNARHLLQATVASQPTLQLGEIGGSAGVLFDGVDDYMQTATFTLAHPVEVFVVGRFTAAGNRTVVDGFAADTMAVKRIGTTAMGAGSGGVTTTGGIGNGGPTDRAAHLWHGVFNGASSRFQADNGTVATATFAAASPAGITVGAPGGTPTGTVFAPVMIGSIVVTGLLSAGEREQVRYWLARKYRDRWI